MSKDFDPPKLGDRAIDISEPDSSWEIFGTAYVPFKVGEPTRFEVMDETGEWHMLTSKRTGEYKGEGDWILEE